LFREIHGGELAVVFLGGGIVGLGGGDFGFERA